MKRTCGRCENQYTWDCPRGETFYYDEDICSCYKGVGQEDDYGIDWTRDDAWCPTYEEEVDKYSWHNLLINPNDLPEHCDQVLICYEVDEQGKYWDYDIGEYWNNGEGWGNTPMTVVAWAYIKNK